MKTERKAIEIIKTAVVMLLLVSLICLCTVYLFGFEQKNSSEFTPSMLQDLRRQSSKSVYSEYFDKSMVMPYFVGLSFSDGTGEGVIAGSEAMNEIYTDVSEYLLSLFGEDGTASELDGEEGARLWTQAMSGDCIYIRYRDALPKSLIYYMTFPDNISESVSGEYISELLIYPTGNPIDMTDTEGYSYAAIAKNDAGEYYVYSLKTAPSKLSDVYFNKERISSYNVKDTVSFEFAGPQYTNLDKMTVLTQSSSAAEAEISFPLSGAEQSSLATAVNAFSINFEKAAKYTDAEGSVVYLEEGHNVKISVDGSITYTVTGTPDGIFLSDFIGISDEYDACDYAGMSLLLMSETGIPKSDASVVLTGVMRNGESIVVTFGYICDNITVSVGGETDLLRFEYTNGMLTSASCRFLSVSLGDEYYKTVQNWSKDIYILTSEKNGTLRFVYDFSSGTKVHATWAAYYSEFSETVDGGDGK